MVGINYWFVVEKWNNDFIRKIKNISGFVKVLGFENGIVKIWCEDEVYRGCYVLCLYVGFVICVIDV